MSNLNDLVEIAGCDHPDRWGDVIFVHGLGGNARGTWHPQERQDDHNFWPAWLGADLPKVGIWSLGYEVEPFKWKGNSMPLADRATNILDLLDSYGIGDRPLIFITHSLGGLLVKQMLRSARDYGKWKAIASKTKGIIFLSTPHSGSDMASWVQHISGILQTTVSVEELEAHHSRLRELNLLYRNDEQFSQIPMIIYCETLPTGPILVVNQTSADPGIKGVIPIPMDFDHISICKVADKKSQIYRQVKRFIEENLTTPSQPEPRQTSELSKVPVNPKMDRRDDHPTVEFEVVTLEVNQSERIAGLGQKVELLTHRRKEQAGYLTENLSKGVVLELVSVPSGSFVMGSAMNEEGRDWYKNFYENLTNPESPQHRVTVKAFWMSQYLVTQAQWRAVASLPKLNRDLNPNPSKFKGDNCPVEQVSWHDAIEFCARLSRQTKHEYRLPSEAEWEYACRAGTTTPFYFGETITTDLANYRGTDWVYQGKTYSGSYGTGPKGIYWEQTTDVHSFPPNTFGLYDMHGNVWEWCFDHWHDNYQGASTDGSAWVSGGNADHRLLRGGSRASEPSGCRSANRFRDFPSLRYHYVGFRVVCDSAWTL